MAVRRYDANVASDPVRAGNVQEMIRLGLSNLAAEHWDFGRYTIGPFGLKPASRNSGCVSPKSVARAGAGEPQLDKDSISTACSGNSGNRFSLRLDAGRGSVGTKRSSSDHRAPGCSTFQRSGSSSEHSSTRKSATAAISVRRFTDEFGHHCALSSRRPAEPISSRPKAPHRLSNSRQP